LYCIPIVYDIALKAHQLCYLVRVRQVLMLVFAGLSLAGCGGDDWNLDGGDLVTLGKIYAGQRACGSCHAGPGDGDTLAGQLVAEPGTSAYGSNLTPDRETGLGGWADIEIIRAMRAGIDNQLMPLCPPMPHYADMGDVEGRSIVAYLRSMPAVARQIPPSMCPPLKPPPPVDMAVPVDQAVPDLLPPTDGGAGD
jgi:hypothetical protein